MKKILSAIAVAASATLPAFAALDPDCVLYYDFETLAEDGYSRKHRQSGRNATRRQTP